MGLGLESSNDNADPAIWPPPHRPSCPVSPPAAQGLENPSETLSFRWLAGDSACRRGTPSMLVLLLPHLDCTALPHCQPIGAAPGSAHVLPFATDTASCHLSAPGPCCTWCAQDLLSGGSRELVIGATGAAASQKARPSYTVHMVLASQECDIPPAWAPLSGGESGGRGWSRGDERVQQAWKKLSCRLPSGHC